MGLSDSRDSFKVALNLSPDELLMVPCQLDPLQRGVISFITFFYLSSQLMTELLGKPAVLLWRSYLVIIGVKLLSSRVIFIQAIHNPAGHFPMQPVHLLID